MKNKKNIYILLPAVILIWSLLGHRVYSGLQPTSAAQEQLTEATFKPQELKEAQSFTISANYKDPFLKKYEHKKPVRKKRLKRTKKTPKIPFPAIVYKGMMSSEGQHSIFLITVNGKRFFFKKRATHSEVKLLKGNAKEVTLQFKGQRQTIALKK